MRRSDPRRLHAGRMPPLRAGLAVGETVGPRARPSGGPGSRQAPRREAHGPGAGEPAMAPRSSEVAGRLPRARRGAMAVGYTPGAGLDVQPKTGTAWRVTPAPRGPQAAGILERTAWGTITADRRALADWRAATGVTPVAMASPAASGRPVDPLREGPVAVWLVHAAHVQQGPGHQTDQAEARWWAPHLRNGLRPARVIPPRPRAIAATSHAIGRRWGRPAAATSTGGQASWSAPPTYGRQLPRTSWGCRAAPS